MHPEIRQIGPGNCPICGMALEPVIVTGEEGDSPELRDMTRRFRIGLVLTLPVFVLEMGGHLVDLHHLIAPQASNWIQLVFATPVVLWAGWPFFERAWASLKPGLALYIGGMGAREKNFYNDLAKRLGYEDAARRIQDLYLDGKKAEASAAVPDALVDAVHLVGPKARIRERLARWKEAARKGFVHTLNVGSRDPAVLAWIAEEVL